MVDNNCYNFNDNLSILESNFRDNLTQKLLSVKSTLLKLNLDFSIDNISALNNKKIECIVRACMMNNFTFVGQKLLQDITESKLTDYILVGAMVNEGFLLRDTKKLSFIFG
ncbi:hypothetical protein GUI12_01255 [Anaplasmataceae bacterium AB001_6]|nr:hypothetical protein GUI12_01255 [Anaplasmataceae bacterium AB001_6]